MCVAWGGVGVSFFLSVCLCVCVAWGGVGVRFFLPVSVCVCCMGWGGC